MTSKQLLFQTLCVAMYACLPRHACSLSVICWESVGRSPLCSNIHAAAGQKIPLEILPLGDFEPIYGSPLNVQAGELPVLPMSIYGAVAMAHAPDADEGFAAADEFFIYKYDRAASGLAGLSFDEGTFGVFGYIARVCHCNIPAGLCLVAEIECR